MTRLLERPRTDADRLPAGVTDQVMRRLFPAAHPLMYDLERWTNEQLGEELWSKQREIAASVNANRYTAVQSAHDTGKSYIASRAAAHWLDTRPLGDAFVVTSAPTQPQINAILWRELRKAHRKGGLQGRITLKAEWYMGHDELVAYGRKPADYVDAEQAMQAFQGIHAEHVLVILDEACGIPQWLFDAADTLATNENARVLAIGNPDDPASPFADVCKPGSGWHVIGISAFDTPAFTGEDVSPELLRLLVSRTWVDERKQRWGEDSHLYQSKVLGIFPDVSDDTLYPPRLVQRAIDTELPGTARGGYGVDVARYGEDETVVYRNRGGVIRLVKAVNKQDTVETTDMVEAILRSHGADRVPAVIDAVGVGAGVFDQLRSRDMPVFEFNGGERALEPDRFVNRRAETMWHLREEMEAGEVDIDKIDDVLVAQLGKIKFKHVTGGRIQVETKEDMRKRGVKSPDRVDAAVMALAAPPALDLPPVKPVVHVTDSGQTVGSLTGDLLGREL